MVDSALKQPGRGKTREKIVVISATTILLAGGEEVSVARKGWAAGGPAPHPRGTPLWMETKSWNKHQNHTDAHRVARCITVGGEGCPPHVQW
jgi:hypothetical protein